jgi:UDP:flavonoid glycosyltransferase YjiC (YdhE family)
MRVLFATTAGEGHFGPMVPFAHACVAAGHEVRVSAPRSFAGVVERSGLVHLPVPDAPEEEIGAVFARLPHLSFEDANAMVMRDVFAGVDARSVLPALTEAVGEWRPDLVVREAAEFASYVVAEQRGVPHVEVIPGTVELDTFTLPLVDAPLRALGAERGADGLRTTPVISVVPPVLDDPAVSERRTVHRFRYAPAASAAEPGGALPPPWGDPDAPLVYASFGTVAASVGLFPVLYRAVVDAVAGIPMRLLLTVGEAGDPEELAPLPANAHAERFWPQQDVMPQAAAMIGHGGFGTTLTGLVHGVPQVVLPLFAIDQHYNAAAVVRAGAGLALDGFAPGASLPDPMGLAAGVPDALTAVLADPRYGEGARMVADEMAALPAPSTSAALFDDLARTPAP